MNIGSRDAIDFKSGLPSALFAFIGGESIACNFW
jgi:hypothetical protein